MQNCKLIAVHAGLEKGKGVKEQLDYLKAKDTRIPKVEALSGRKNVWDIPEVIRLIINFCLNKNRVTFHGIFLDLGLVSCRN